MADKVSVWVSSGFGYVNIITGTFISVINIDSSWFPVISGNPLGSGYDTPEKCSEAIASLVSKIGEIEII